MTTRSQIKPKKKCSKPMEKILSKGINQPPLPSDYPEYIARVERHLDRMVKTINASMRNLEWQTSSIRSLAQMLDSSICNAKVEFDAAREIHYKHKNILDSIFYAMDILVKRTKYLEDLMRAQMEDAPESKNRVRWAEQKRNESQ